MHESHLMPPGGRYPTGNVYYPVEVSLPIATSEGKGGSSPGFLQMAVYFTQALVEVTETSLLKYIDTSWSTLPGMYFRLY